MSQQSTTNHTYGLWETEKPNRILHVLPEQTGSWSSKIRQTSHGGKELSLQVTESSELQEPLVPTDSSVRKSVFFQSPESSVIATLKDKAAHSVLHCSSGFRKQPHHKVTEPPRTSVGRTWLGTQSTLQVISSTGLLPTPLRSCQRTNHYICTSASDILTVSSSIC